jgi:hypothetical protein
VTDDDLHVPAEDILQHVVYGADGQIPFGWHVFVLKDIAALNRLRALAGDDTSDAYAWTIMHVAPDDDNVIGEMYFVAGWVYVGMIAHEALHLASWMCRYPTGQWPIRGRQQTQAARMTFGREPEQLAEIVGQLTSVVWYNLAADGMVDVDA